MPGSNAGSRDAAGFVLAGGRSSRMGTDKALLPYRGVPMAKYIALQLQPAVHRVSLVGDPSRYNHLGYSVIPDDYPGAGPVGGIITALRASQSLWNLICACDLPGISTDFFDEMLSRIRLTGAQCLIPVAPDGHIQPLCAVYRRDCAEALAQTLEAGESRLRTAIRTLAVEFRPVPTGDWAANLNTPEQWAAYARVEA